MSGDKMTLAVDCHVHLYQFADLPRLLAAVVINSEKACGNLPKAAREMSGKAILPTLILTEPKDRDSFARIFELASGSEQQTLSGWHLRSGGDALSVFAEGDDGAVLIISGQQVVTAERLEILAVGCQPNLEDGLALTATLAAIHKKGAFPVFPWGVGKWLGRRGRLLSDLISQAKREDFALADTSSRPLLWSEPLFTAVRAKGLVMLRGTDPLPLPGQVEKAGAFGSLMRILFNSDRPAASLLAGLRGGSLDILSFGQPDSCRAFLGTQLDIRFKKVRK